IGGFGLLAASVLFLPFIVLDRSPKNEPTPARPAASYDRVARGSLLVPGRLVFISGFCVMLVEIIASRLVAGHSGQSLYTWTSVSGVILGGISVGNWLGGVLADRFPSRPLVGVLFFVSSVLTMTVLVSHQVVANATAEWMGETSWATRVLTVVFVAFFFPSAALGTISPAVAKWALDYGYAAGRTVGTIYAWNTWGSICGTFCTGFFLISMFYCSKLLTTASLGLALIATWFLLSSGRFLPGLTAGLWSAAASFAVYLAILPAAKFEEVVLTLFPVPEVQAEELTYKDEGAKGELVVPKESDLKRTCEKRERERLRFAAGLLCRNEEVNLYDQYNFRDDFQFYDESNYYTIQVSEETVESNLLDDFEIGSNGEPTKNESDRYVPRQRLVRQLILDALIHGYVDMQDHKYLHY
ncbi:MAG: fused MFS/spermidine synthase, partial [Planctomycetia bacterium]